ncbi:MAG: metallophosphoesterase [Parachlamydiaceae bacterium]
MAVWAIGDLHLSFGVSDKEMDVFGVQWKNYTEKIEYHWRSLIAHDDLVLIPGDISWGMRIEDARPDLAWIGGLPGTKVMIKGNHDYWWSSLSKIKTILPPSCHLIQNNSWSWQGIAIGGTRLWDIPGLNFHAIIDFKENERCKKPLTESDNSIESEKIYQRELGRLETSLKSMDRLSKTRIVMTHYPPIGAGLEETDVSRLLEKYKVDICLFGHLHNVKRGLKLFGDHRGVTYHLTSCDYLEDFKPLRIY